MIKYFTIKNYKSIKNENILEFDSNLGKDYPYPASPVIGFAGANASGKSNVLQALTFVLWFMQHSFLKLDKNANIPYEPFIKQRELPTQFNLIFTNNTLINKQEKLIDYEYYLSMLQDRVIIEKLYYYPYKRKRLVYERQENQVKFGQSIRHLEQETLLNLRKNSSIISFAAQFASQTIAQECKEYNFETNISYQGMSEYNFHPLVMKKIDENEQDKKQIKTLLKIADIGIEDFEFKLPNQTELSKSLKAIQQFSEENNGQIAQSALKVIEDMLKSKELPEMIKELGIYSLLFQHNINGYLEDFSADQESAGTLQFITLLEKIIEALDLGSLLIIDEIEIKLHQNLVAYLVGLFQNKYENPKGAQLIFSFHNTSLMEILEPHQLWFTEKNDQGQTEIFSAADFKDIKDLYKRNLEKLYRLGRFGAKPRGI